MVLINEFLLEDARRGLQDRIAAIDTVCATELISKDFPLQGISQGFRPGSIAQWIKPLVGTECSSSIYRLSVREVTTAHRLETAFRDFREKSVDALARLNQTENSTVLYVGSSRSIWTRLRQHLESAPRKTYALKMGLWCPEDEGLLRVEVMPFHGVLSQYLIQDLEDALWKRSQPMFGKFGGH